MSRREGRPCEQKNRFEYEEEYEPCSVTYMTCSRVPGSRSQFEGLRKQIEKDTAIRTPAAKAASIPNFFLYRTANNPPASVETNVSAPKIIANRFMHHPLLPPTIIILCQLL